MLQLILQRRDPRYDALALLFLVALRYVADRAVDIVDCAGLCASASHPIHPSVGSRRAWGSAGALTRMIGQRSRADT